MLPSVRFLLRLQDPWGWDIIGRNWLKAFLDAGFSTRAIGTVLGDLDTPEWETVRDAFPRVTGLGPYDLVHPVSLDGYALNVVCGCGEDFSQWYTEGKKNIAITGCRPRPPDKDAERQALERYDRVVVSSEDMILMQFIIPGRQLVPCKPKGPSVKFMVEQLLQEIP